MKVEYYNGKIINGIKYDYDLINREFKKMLKECNAPTGLYNPCDLPLDMAKWFVLMSERSSSKTTQLILYSAIFWKYYGTLTAYVRSFANQITQSMYINLFNVVTDARFGYVEYLTDDKYNNIFVDRQTKQCYFANIDTVTGKVLERADSPFMLLICVEDYERYCSTLNVPMCDIILFDEFSWGNYARDSFEHLCQIIATIRRERESVRIIMMSNTISPYNEYLRELGISSQLVKMHKGQHAIITSELGTRVYCAMLDVGIHQTKDFSRKSLEYFGFANESLRALYGGEWEIKGFRHLPKSENRKIIYTNVLLDYMGNYMRVCSFYDGKQHGVFICRHTGKVNNKWTIVTDTPTYNTDAVEISHGGLIRKLKTINNLGLLYVSDNETGLSFNALCNSIIKTA